MGDDPSWRLAALWWKREEPDIGVEELAGMLGVDEAKLWRIIGPPPTRNAADQARADEVKAAVRSGMTYDALARRFGWPGARRPSR